MAGDGVELSRAQAEIRNDTYNKVDKKQPNLTQIGQTMLNFREILGWLGL